MTRSSTILRAGLFALAAVFAVGSALGQENQAALTDDPLQAQAAEFLQTVVAGMRVSDSQGDEASLRPRSTPVLRYSDPARVYPAAGVWRLADTGRPPLLVSLEYWLRADTDEPRIMFEFISFTEDKLELKADEQTAWKGDGGARFAKIEDAPKPATSKNQRLIQMRSLARRFSASEKHMGEPYELRLLPQPIDRYDDKSHDVTDAAMFVFAYGTNPELVLLLEAVEDGWQYAAMRMSWAELAVKLDDNEVIRFEQLSTFPTKGAYQTAGHVTRALAGASAATDQ